MYSLQRYRLKAVDLLMSVSLKPVVLSGPSGAGKSTLLKKLFQEYPDSFGFSVSHTTRKKRDGEVEGKQYHFTTVEEIKQEINEGKFVEHTNFSGNYYGTSKAAVEEVLNTQRICILDIDEQGVRNIKESDLEAVYVFIKPPSMEELRRRLSSRGTETEESLERRMSTAVSAIKFSEEPGIYDLVLENKELETAYLGLRSFLKQTCPRLMEKMNSLNGNAEVPLAAGVKYLANMHRQEAGDSAEVNCNGFSNIKLESSIAEIPLSPTKTAADYEDPAVVNVGETPILLINEISSDASDFKNNSPIVVDVEQEGYAPADGVCGRQSWCIVL